jgi:hypothetical protein
MHDVEPGANIIFGLEHGSDKGPAHIIDIIDKICGSGIGNPVVVYTVDAIVVPVAMPTQAGKYMHFMAFPLQCRRQFGHMDCHAADTDGMERFPRKMYNSHLLWFPCLFNDHGWRRPPDGTHVKFPKADRENIQPEVLDNNE